MQQSLTLKLSPLGQPAYLMYVISASLAGSGVYLPVNYMVDYSNRLQLEAHSLSVSFLPYTSLYCTLCELTFTSVFGGYHQCIFNSRSFTGRVLGRHVS
jgi:hypothetical protein